VDLEEFRHGTLFTEINNVDDHGPLFLSPTALLIYLVRLKLH